MARIQETKPQVGTLKVRVKDTYPNQFWNSGTGLTLRRDDRVGQEWREDDPVVFNALKMNILELAPAEQDLKLIRDTPSKENVMKEVVGEQSSTELRKTVKRMKEKQTMKPVIVGADSEVASDDDGQPDN